jgi:fumarylacetoacetate (FAA) hydrolase family protein
MIHLPDSALLLGRVWRAGIGPSLVTLRAGRVLDITTRAAPTMRDLLEQADITAFVAAIDGIDIGSLAEIADNSVEATAEVTRLLAPCDLQAVKACGVTFARSMVERVIEERAGGDPGRAAEVRARIAKVIGDSLRDLVPGSAKAAEVKAVLQAEGLWSQYLEVGIGPDAEVFTKAQPMSAVGWGASVGLHPISQWNNPEPEVVLVVDSSGRIVGATLGNDVNLRDVEGRSALLLGKAKDNNAAASLGPFIRVFDDGFTLENVRRMELSLTVTGRDGFSLIGRSSMAEISRDPADLVAQTRGRHHQYPDGFLLYCGTMFSPVQDRDGPGQGFTHHLGDIVTIATPELGALTNTVRLSTESPEWTFGTRALMTNLAARGLL